MPIRIVTPPSAEPVSLSEAKAQLRLEHTADDAFVGTLIKSAREYVEQVCWCGLVTQTVELVMNSFPDWCYPSQGSFVGGSKFELPFGRLVSVTSVKYIDVNGVEQTMSPADYSVDNVSAPGRIYLGYNKTWPSTRAQWDAVRVQYIVGTDDETVPASLKQAMLLLISQMYEHRTPEITGTIIAAVQFSFDALIQPHRLVRI